MMYVSETAEIYVRFPQKKRTVCFEILERVCTFPRLKRTGCFLKKVGKVVYLSDERKDGGIT